MKILMIAMKSIHFKRWTSQLENSGHKVYWFDILNGGYIKELPWVEQITDWRYKGGNYKGRYLLKKTLPRVHKWLENDLLKTLEKIIANIEPDVVHSFVMYNCTAPILGLMKKNKIPWIYSAWGNDLYYYQRFETYKKEIITTLPFVDYLFADCKRDVLLARKLGFKGVSLGVFPGGGGYHLDLINQPIKEVEERAYLIIKGYQGEKHRGLNVLKAIEGLENLPPIIIFSADEVVYDYYQNSSLLLQHNIKVYKKDAGLSHKELCKLMNASLVYVGNNLSDGMPNTLLESICFGAFPIQSNPGGASAEIIDDGDNGLLINDCEDIEEIREKIAFALENKTLLKKAFKINMQKRETIEFNYIRKKVLEKYAITSNEKVN